MAVDPYFSREGKKFPMFTIKHDYAPKQCLRMLCAWASWKVPMEQQIQWLKQIREEFHDR